MALLALVDIDGTLLLSDDPVAGEAFGGALRDCYPVEVMPVLGTGKLDLKKLSDLAKELTRA